MNASGCHSGAAQGDGAGGHPPHRGRGDLLPGLHRLHYVWGPFETTLEGDLDQLLDIVKECCRICVSHGEPSMLAYVKISYKPRRGVDDRRQDRQIPKSVKKKNLP